MKQKFLDRIQTLSKKKQLLVWFLTGFLIGLLLYSVCLFLSYVHVLNYTSWELFFAFCPILIFFVTHYLDLDRWPTVLVYIGAFLAYVIFHFSLANFFEDGALLVVGGAILGVLSYRGKADGWVGWILRILSLSPTLFITLIFWDSYSFLAKLIFLILALIIHYMIRRKLVFRLRNLIFFTIYTVLAATQFFNLSFYVVFLILNPWYYP